MRIARLGTAVIAVLALAGCAVAPPSGPSVMAMPGQGKSFEAFQGDDAACRQYAAQQTGIAPQDAATQSLVGSAALGTVLGAAAGAAIGAAAGNPAMGAAIGAGSGAVLGTGYGAGAAQYSASSVQYRYDTGYVQCMSAKGESVQMPTAQTAYAAPAYGYPAYPYYPAYSYPYYGPAYYGPAFVGVGFGWRGGWRGGWHGGWHR
jgi:outer membrane lipoprotein SlyB